MVSTDIELIDGKYTLGQKSVVGDPRRKWEDRTYVGRVERGTDDPLIIGIVADGVGSADNGARGAEFAIQTVVNKLGNSRGEDIPRIIIDAVEAANTKLFRENEEHESDGLTTLVVGIIYKERLYVGNVGDSRAYWAQSSGKILQLTRDHTYFNVYGGDPKSEEAGVVVNAVGKKSTVQVDLGFYLKGNGQDQKGAYRLGMAGLPLHKGDSFLLCSDGLIKGDPKRGGEPYVSDKEIVDALNSEYRPDLAAIKMVSRAEGQRPDDNVSAVTVQCLTAEIVAGMKANTERAHQARLLRRILLGVSITALVGLVVVLAVLLIRIITKPPAMIAQVQQVDGDCKILTPLFQNLDDGTSIDTSCSGVKIGVSTTTTTSTSNILYLFPNTSATINFKGKLAPALLSGMIYIQPASAGTGEVHFDMWPDLTASVTGSRMIVEIKDTDIWIYCFEGTCKFDNGNNSKVTIDPGFKQAYHTVTGQWADQVKMDYDDGRILNEGCHGCMADIIPSPTPSSTPTPTFTSTFTPSPTFTPTSTPRPIIVQPTDTPTESSGGGGGDGGGGGCTPKPGKPCP